MVAKTKEAKSRLSKKKLKRNLISGLVHIYATFNNTIVTITDPQGNVVSWATAGGSGFKGSRKSTPYAAQMAARKACLAAKDLGLKTVEIYLEGPGPGRESAAREVAANGIKVTLLREKTLPPFNGCRQPKPRRV